MTQGPTLSGVGVALPQSSHPEIPSAADIRAIARRGEELGFASLWVCELTTVPLLDSLLTLSFAAAVTERVRLGVAIVLTALRQPVRLADELATLDRLSDGRLIFGTGFGSNPALYARYGLSPDRRLGRYLKSLDVMEQLWSGETVSSDSDWWKLDSVLGLSTIDGGRPPIWFGARRGKALRRAATRGDGWIISGSAPPDEYLPALEEVRATLNELERPRDGFTIAKRIYIAHTDDSNSTRRRSREWFAAHYGDGDLADRVAIVGDEADCVDQLQQIRQAGVDHLILNPMFDERAQVEALAEHVLPHLVDADKPT